MIGKINFVRMKKRKPAFLTSFFPFTIFSRIIVLVFSAFIFYGCEKFEIDRSAVTFGLENKTQEEIVQVNIYIQDTKLKEIKPIDSLKLVVDSGTLIIPFEKIELGKINLRQFSKNGHGDFSAEVIFSSGRKIRNGLGIYKNYKVYTEFLPRNYQTIVIEVDSVNGIFGKTVRGFYSSGE